MAFLSIPYPSRERLTVCVGPWLFQVAFGRFYKNFEDFLHVEFIKIAAVGKSITVWFLFVCWVLLFSRLSAGFVLDSHFSARWELAKWITSYFQTVLLEADAHKLRSCPASPPSGSKQQHSLLSLHSWKVPSHKCCPFLLFLLFWY